MTFSHRAAAACPPPRRGAGMTIPRLASLLLLGFALSSDHAVASAASTTRAERKEALKAKVAAKKAEAANFERMKREGADMISNTPDAIALREYQLRKKKTKGLIVKKEKSLSSVLFPGVSPEDYVVNEPIAIQADLAESRKTQVPYKFYDLPVCKKPPSLALKKFRKNLGSRLQGYRPEAAPFALNVLQDKPCTPICAVSIGGRQLRWMRKLVNMQYRVHLSLDQLPVLMRSKEINYAVRGYPVGFKAPPSYTGLKSDELYLFNHLKFTVTYHEDPSQFEGIHITGFDVHPVSIRHDFDSDAITPSSDLSTCNANSGSPVNDPNTYLPLRTGKSGEALKVVYSYEVQWEKQDIPWSDRWDVYLVGSPDDDIHYFAIVNSLMVVVFLMAAVATIMIRTLRKDIAGYNEMQMLEEAQEQETGWKLVHGDVFRPPTFSPMLLSVLCGTGVQIGTAVVSVLLCSVVGLMNPMKKGQALSSIIFLYVLSGSVAGYCSSRLYKFCDGKDWKKSTVMTAAAFPGVIVSMFVVLNTFLGFAGAATAVSFWLVIAIFLLWVGVSTPLAFVGSYFGFRAPKDEVPTKTNQIARFIPEQPLLTRQPFAALLCGVLPFGSVCIELFFIMSALWLHQYYYVMGFLLAVVFILVTTCATVSIVICYIQLCSEDHRWWWKSFANTASAGFFLLLYSLWFLASKLQLVGVLPVVVYLTYMTMISIALALFCGSIGFYSCFWFVKKIYGAVKVD